LPDQTRLRALCVELAAVIDRFSDLSPGQIGAAMLSGWISCQGVETEDAAIELFATALNRLKEMGELR